MRSLKQRTEPSLDLQVDGPVKPTMIGGAISGAPTSGAAPAFNELLVNALDQVNALQKESARLSTAIEQGDRTISISQAVIASEKASVAFQATTEVRNKLVNAYETIMNMPI